MKKNTMMRLASALLVLVLLTTCAISGTFAKYVTSAEAGDSARVAKFGVVITAATDLFYDSYKETFQTYTKDEKVATITVQASSEGTDVVAPGTEGVLAGFGVTGAPEVDVEVTYDAELTLAGWAVDVTDDDTDNAVYYCPIEITVNGTVLKGLDYASMAEFETAVEEAIESKKATYHTNENLNQVNDDVEVSWKWAFDTNDDAKDTELGDLAAADKAATIALTVKTTITQLN